MKVFSAVTALYKRPKVEDVLRDKLEQAELDLLDAEANLEMYEASVRAYKERIARLKAKIHAHSGHPAPVGLLEADSEVKSFRRSA